MADGTKTRGTAAPESAGDIPPYTIPYRTFRGAHVDLTERVPRAGWLTRLLARLLRPVANEIQRQDAAAFAELTRPVAYGRCNVIPPKFLTRADLIELLEREFRLPRRRRLG